VSKPEKRQLKTPMGAILTKYLRVLALDVETVDESGDPLTKAQVLAALVWRHALGFVQPDPNKKGAGTPIPPAVWAIELLYNRIEGKIPVAVVEESGRSLTEKVSDLGKARINSLAKASTEEEVDADKDS
jgi:hypothetical protein